MSLKHSFFGLSYLSTAFVGDPFTNDIMSIAPEHYRCQALASYVVDNYIDTTASFQTDISAEALSDNRRTNIVRAVQRNKRQKTQFLQQQYGKRFGLN